MADINVIVLPDGTEYPVSDYYLPVAISNPTDGQVLKYNATNHVWYNGDDAEGSSVFYGTSAPTSQLGANGNLYVKYTEGTGGASDTVDALYVKLDGTWCQISTGGGGGASSADEVSVDDTDLEYEADDVQEALEKIYKRITLAEYEQLSHDEKYNGTIYFITDVKGANQILTKEITNTPIATFETDRAERLVKCVCEVASGASEINVVACGKNFFLHSGNIDQRNITYSVLGDDITLTATAVAGNQQQLLMYLDSRVFGGKTITFSYDSATSSYSGAVPYVYFVVNGTTVKSLTVPSQKTFTYALPSSYTSAILLLRMYQGGSVSIGSTLTISECQLEINDEHTTFEPFGTTYNIQFGETLSDTATYDAISGVLTRNDSTTKQLDSCNIIALDNETNNVYADTGDIIDLKFVLSVGQAIS